MIKILRRLIRRLLQRLRTSTPTKKAYQPNPDYQHDKVVPAPEATPSPDRPEEPVASETGRYENHSCLIVDPISSAVILDPDLYEDRANELIPELERLCSQLVEQISSGDWTQAKALYDRLIKTNTAEKEIYENLYILKATHFDRVRTLKADTICFYTLSLIPNSHEIAALRDQINSCLQHPEISQYNNHREIYECILTLLPSADESQVYDKTSATAARKAGAFHAPSIKTAGTDADVIQSASKFLI
ncbi:MAG: hypothetical protein K0U29_00470 [Gammaproteobacteria bacterium]|nr:hypothetical protein [Gammaproteobacteria bacterium]